MQLGGTCTVYTVHWWFEPGVLNLIPGCYLFSVLLHNIANMSLHQPEATTTLWAAHACTMYPNALQSDLFVCSTIFDSIYFITQCSQISSRIRVGEH